METLNLTKEQLGKITEAIRAVEATERNSDSAFVRRFFEELVNNKIVSFGIIAASNRLTNQAVDDFYTTYSWLIQGKEVFANKGDNRALEQITNRVFTILTACDPKKFAAKDKTGAVVGKKISDQPRGTGRPFNDGDIFLYGGTEYLVLDDSGNNNRLRIVAYRNGMPGDNVQVLTGAGTIDSVRRNCLMIQLIENQPEAVDVGVDRNPLNAQGQFRYTLLSSLRDNPEARARPVSRVPNITYLGSGMPATITYRRGQGPMFTYEGITYRVAHEVIYNNFLMFKCVKVLDALEAGYDAIYVTANFFRRNEGRTFQYFIDWYKRHINYALAPDRDTSIDDVQRAYGALLPELRA